ncbi:MAG: hypothetical protein BROFUL_01546 [Candidatus Brocadia fulgida]|uniref:Adenosine monophosphate-protein transferase n=1 Tax=Candidatus Brocadia fulgida TaxID=380242 RepID=A0A0M2UVZ1_9BACT|nr:MAG: hypothetical protein BROFUL_01546 [Candidatus Brocadia fulgida]
MLEIKPVALEIPDGANVILGQTHFIKTAEDLYEAMVNAAPDIQLGLPSVRHPVRALSGQKAITPH